MIKGIFPKGFLFFWYIHVHIMYNDQCFRDAMQNPAQNFQQIKKSKKENTFLKELFVDFQSKKKPSQKELYHKFALFSSPHLMSPPPQHTVHLSE